MKGNYFFFSNERLDRISAAVDESLKSKKADFNFFHGITSWIRYKSDTPYYAYTDACFATYVSIFNDRNAFSPRDLERIFTIESEWLQNASKVFFRTQWALEETKKAYGISGKNFRRAGLGGFIDIPPKDVYGGGKNLLFISREFIPKGGVHCFLAFEKLYEQHSELTLTIIGDKPPENVLNHPGVRYEGFLRKNDEAEYKRFKELIGSAFLLIHPTVKDTNALVLTEAGYFGCPAVTTELFALPELIQNSKTGFLIPVPVHARDIVDILLKLINDPAYYSEVRKNVREHTTAAFTWENVGNVFHREMTDSGS